MKPLAALMTVLALSSLARAEDTAAAPDVARIFPLQAEVRTPGGGLVRLPLSREVLEASQFDFSDLRLFDRAGHEVPYFIDSGPPPGDAPREAHGVDARVLEVRRSEPARADAQRTLREIHHLGFPGSPPAGRTWHLVVESDRQRFVRSIEVRGRVGNGLWDELVPRAGLIRLGQPRADRTEVELPPFSGSEISVEIDGEEDFYLEPRFRYRSAPALAAGEAIELPLTLARTSSADGRTLVELRRPVALMPTRLRIGTSTPALERAVTVRDGGLMGTRRALGTGRLVRAGTVEQLELDVEPTRSDRLLVEIVDGDGPPLANLVVTGLMRRPALVFALPAAPAGEPAGMLYFGGHRAWRPHYDLETVFQDGGATAGASPDASAIPLAELGPPRPNPTFDKGPALAPIMHAGATVDSRSWRWMSVVRVPASSEGVVRVKLAVSDLPHVRRDLGDLRIVDGRQRQWPYIVGPGGPRQALELRVAGPGARDGESHWTVTSPVASLPIDRLVITPAQPMPGRAYRVVARGPGGRERTLASGTLTQDPSGPAPVAIALDTLAPGEQLELVVHDGDDAPVALRSVAASFVLPELLLAAPPGEYTMLAGNPDVEPPSYELDRVREMMLGLRRTDDDGDAFVSWAVVNPGFGAAPLAAAPAREGVTQVVLWAAILISVAVVAIAVRLGRGATIARRN